MKNELAIKVDSVFKDFLLPHEKSKSLKSTIINIFNTKDKHVEKQHALKNISFEIKKGEFLGIVGRNGSGKSTLLKILAGIYQPTKGKVHVNGKLVPFIELGVGFNPELTGRENVYLNGALLGFSRKEIQRKYNDIVEFAELDRFMDQKLKNYSSGMQVRLSFSVATKLAESDILLIDEVLAVGDADFQRKCFNYFKDLKSQHKTIVFVSHDMSAIREFCDRAILIDNSIISQIASTEEVAASYNKLFIHNNELKSENSDRYGTGDMKSSSIKVKFSKGSLFIFQKVLSFRDIENPIIGFRIISSSGIEITGTNTRIEKIKTGIFKSGSMRTVRWKMPAVLSDGEFYIEPAILDYSGIEVLDWWNRAAKIKIVSERRLPYYIDTGFEVDIN